MYMHTLIDENAAFCGGTIINSVTPPICIPQTTQTDGTTTTVTPRITSSRSDSLSKSAIAGIVSFVVVTTVLASIILLMVIMIIIQRKKWKKQKQTIINSDDNNYSNPTYDSELVPWPIVNLFKND